MDPNDKAQNPNPSGMGDTTPTGPVVPSVPEPPEGGSAAPAGEGGAGVGMGAGTAVGQMPQEEPEPQVAEGSVMPPAEKENTSGGPTSGAAGSL